jgi:hypothetical protein
MTLGASVLAAIAILTARETYDKTLAEIDGVERPVGVRSGASGRGAARSRHLAGQLAEPS